MEESYLTHLFYCFNIKTSWENTAKKYNYFENILMFDVSNWGKETEPGMQKSEKRNAHSIVTAITCISEADM